MKVYTKIILDCSHCPNHIVDGGDGESPWTFSVCSEINKTLNNFPVIPDFCPLKDMIDNLK